MSGKLTQDEIEYGGQPVIAGKAWSEEARAAALAARRAHAKPKLSSGSRQGGDAANASRSGSTWKPGDKVRTRHGGSEGTVSGHNQHGQVRVNIGGREELHHHGNLSASGVGKPKLPKDVNEGSRGLRGHRLEDKPSDLAKQRKENGGEFDSESGSRLDQLIASFKKSKVLDDRREYDIEDFQTAYPELSKSEATALHDHVHDTVTPVRLKVAIGEKGHDKNIKDYIEGMKDSDEPSAYKGITNAALIKDYKLFLKYNKSTVLGKEQFKSVKPITKSKSFYATGDAVELKTAVGRRLLVIDAGIDERRGPWVAVRETRPGVAGADQRRFVAKPGDLNTID